MEVKINREIRDYTESMFFGLSMRQFFFSVAAIGIAVVLYVVLKPIVGLETVSWLCIIAAAPFAAMGFVKYHGMSAEQFIWVWLRSELIEPRELKFEATNIYYEMMELSTREEKSAGKGRKKNGSKNNDEPHEAGEGAVQDPPEGPGHHSGQKHMD